MRLLVVGGGFYGASIAAACADDGDDVVLVESREDILLAASAVNQARVHGGYHYPRARVTALRSRTHYRKFVEDYGDAVDTTVSALYAIARESRTTTRQFQQMMRGIGAPLVAASDSQADLFDRRLIDSVFRVDEAVYDVDALRVLVRRRLAAAGVEVRTGCDVVDVLEGTDEVRVVTSAGEFAADFVVLATYGASTDTALGRYTSATLHCEPCEMLLVEVPEAMAKLAVTVMDGPFFSLFPYPSRGLHTLSHVRYTPHGAFASHAGASGAMRDGLTSRAPWMLRDSQRLMPSLRDVVAVDALWSVKVVAGDRDFDDARPIVLEGGPGDRVVSVLGSKMDNVTDAIHVVQELKRTVDVPSRIPGVLVQWAVR